MSRVSGRHFLQIPGPTPVPERVLRAMDKAVIDHRGPEFAKLGLHVLERVKTIFKTESRVFIFPASGTGAWEASLSNTLNPGDKVLMFETGHFAFLWKNMAQRLGLDVDYIESDWRVGVDVSAVEEKLREDKNHAIKAVCMVHNETSTGTTSRMDQVRKAIDAASHPALFMVDTVSSLAAIDYRHDEWGVDVAVCGSQKGLMLPPGLGFTAVSDKAMAASKDAKLHRAFFAWDEMEAQNKSGMFPYTPATSLLYGLSEAIDMLHEEGLDNVFARHRKYGEAVRSAVAHWGLEIVSSDSQFHSPVVTTIMMPEAKGGDAFRKLVLDNFDVSLGAGLSKLADKIFRIGHIGDTNDLTILAALAGVEMSLGLAGIPHKAGGVQVAMDCFASAANKTMKAAAE